MSNIEKILQVPKELSEVADALISLVSDIKDKKELAEIIAGNLTKLMTAVEGFEALDEEAKTPQFPNAIGYIVAGLGQIFFVQTKVTIKV